MFQEQSDGKARRRKRKSKINPNGKVKREKVALRKVEKKDWSAMPGDCLSAIFEKVGPFDVLLTSQFVCRSWQQAAHDPSLWRCVDYTDDAYWDVFSKGALTPLQLVRAVVDRSKGSMEVFGLECARQEEDEALLYVAHRSSKLKRLKLINCLVGEKTIIETFKLCPLLEDVNITIHRFGKEFFDDPLSPHWPPLLKRFCLNEMGGPAPSGGEIHNYIAQCIARNMPQLRELQLIGNSLSNEGLRAILDGCPHLESLNIRLCYNVDLQDEDIKRRCSRIKDFLGPLDYKGGFPLPPMLTDTDTDTDDNDFYY